VILRRLSQLALLPDGALPTEFKLFSPGVNETANGPNIFDAEAAASVMAAYERAGVDLMIDLEHESLDKPIRADSRDARGWAKLSLRPDGSLWAVDVRWTPDGARRLTEKTQRYVSPAFYADDDGRILELVNCAICAMPATYDAPALVAASRPILAQRITGATFLSTAMNADQVKAALDAIEAGDSAGAIEILKALIATAASGEAPGAEPVEPMADAPVAESADAPVVEALKRELGCATIAEAFVALSALKTRVKTVDDESAALDNTKRVELVAELVKLGAETPATAWDGKPEKRMPVARLAGESVVSLSARVTALRASKPAPRTAPTAPVVTLSKRELDACAAKGITPEEFIERKAKLVRRGT
jgi:phage I-like protein